MSRANATITAHSRMKLITADGLEATYPTPPTLHQVPALIGRKVTPVPCPTCGMAAEEIPPRQYVFREQQGNLLVYVEITP